MHFLARPAGNLHMLTPVTALMGIDTRLKLARLYLVTDARAATGDLAPFASAALAGGVDMIQLADADLDTRAELDALATLRTAAQQHQALLATFGNPDIAGEFAADVLHLPDDGSDAKKARRSLHQFAVVGRSCRDADDIARALADEAVDYLVVNADITAIEYTAQLAPPADPESKPWFAAGGITLDYLDVVLEAGARRVMVSRALSRAKDPQQAAAAFRAKLQKVWHDPAMEAVTMSAFKSGPLVGDAEAFPYPPKPRDDGLSIG